MDVSARAALPGVTALEPNYPNPFNPSTVISFVTARPSEVSVTIHDILGRTVCTLVHERLSQGRHTVTWRGIDDHGRRVASGVYLCRFTSGTFLSVHKIVLTK
jgi:hypothetical protein